MKRARSDYILEFNKEAVRLVRTGQRHAQVSASLGISGQTLCNWIKAEAADRLTERDDFKPFSQERQEINRLKAELARVQPFLGARAVDVALDIEVGVDTFDGLECHRRDRRRIFPAPCIGGDVGELKELASGMAPAHRRNDPRRRALWRIEAVVAAVSVGLKKAGPARKMTLRMPGSSIARGVEQRRRRAVFAERAVVADIDSDTAGVGLALGEDRNRSVVAVQANGSQDVSFDQRVQRGPGGGAGPDMIGQRREAEVDPFARVAFALAV